MLSINYVRYPFLHAGCLFELIDGSNNVFEHYELGYIEL